ncbi:MAG: SDR family oxidoreductase [Pseudomonadota bacterium]|nr:SDR family oxidoreductase [Pseudomonadota bacterium]
MIRITSLILTSLLLVSAFSSAIGNSNFDEKNSTVLVTGANRGIGFEFTKQYAELGWNVIATARKPEAADDLNQLAKKYTNIAIEQLDVRDLAMIDSLAEKYTDQPIDVLLNNAGISGSPSPEQSFRRLNYELFNPFMETNAMGPLKMSEAFLKNVQASKQKKIVVVTSSGGLFSRAGMMNKGTYFYRASKAAVNMLMIQVADDVKRRGISVILLNPGLVDTQLILTEMNEKMNLGLTLIPIKESISGMRKSIRERGLDETGRVFEWNGEPLDF